MVLGGGFLVLVSVCLSSNLMSIEAGELIGCRGIIATIVASPGYRHCFKGREINEQPLGHPFRQLLW